MAVDETESHVVHAELDHDAAFVAISNRVNCSVVRVVAGDMNCISFLDEDNEEHLALSNVVHLDEFTSQVLFGKLYLILFLGPHTLLSTVCNDVVATLVGEQSRKVNNLGRPSLVPCHAVDFK